MGRYKPFKIKLSNGTAGGMYLLAEESEIKDDKFGNTKAPTKRAYKIQIEVEVIFEGKRKRGKKSFSIPSGTSIIKAVQSLQGKKNEMIETLKTKGTLKTEKTKIVQISQTDGNFAECWLAFYAAKVATDKIKQSTYNTYKDTFDTYLSPIYKKKVDEITIGHVQEIINNALNAKKSPAKISMIKPIIKPLLEHYDVILNWKKLIEPKVDNERKYKKTKEETQKIIHALLHYEHPQIRAIFHFSLTGRRISEVLALRYENINWETNTYIIPKENVKTRKALEFQLTPQLIEAIQSRGKIKKEGLVFSLKSKWVLVHFKRCMASLDIYDLTLHDLRSLVAQTALDNGANIYDVSALLAHSTISTTEKRYVDKNKDHAQKALDTFTKATALLEEDIIDVDVIEDKFLALRNLYPDANDGQIKQAINILEANKLLN
jgi:integrase